MAIKLAAATIWAINTQSSSVNESGVRKSNSWFKAGARTEPPASLPKAKSHKLFDTADAEPEDYPPEMRSGAALSGHVAKILNAKAKSCQRPAPSVRYGCIGVRQKSIGGVVDERHG